MISGINVDDRPTSERRRVAELGSSLATRRRSQDRLRQVFSGRRNCVLRPTTPRWNEGTQIAEPAGSTSRAATTRIAFPRIGLVLLHLFVLMLVLPAGCRTVSEPTYAASRPARHTVASGGFTVYSDIPISADSDVIRQLETVQQQVIDELQLPPQDNPVSVYLFTDEPSYRTYMRATWSHLPPRRAYFVGSPRELAVYSFIGPNVHEDLRHEFTHGLLHASLKTVPLWLDEGLAEYFEVQAGVVGAPHPAHLKELRAATLEGWTPNLYRLELMNDFRDLTQRDYAESWVWVHFLLNGDSNVRGMFLQYLHELRAARVPQRLLSRIEELVPDWQSELRQHIDLLQSTQPTEHH